MSTLIKKEELENNWEITLQKFEYGYEVCVNIIGSNNWHDTEGIFTNKKEAIKCYNYFKNKYKIKEMV